eukprot:gnl/TRDRNA2_/TRDRNA2_76468_c1_seq1.p1 gnl/TRDRNA2_/TRDRNA2_76468_c1~~gnl/TRDRNA2_/TRDRNA2_76468_c1_seq1.p1  ORF type:complete len:144 (-),score=39.24 gnl/TRDRNA2_/TRDRNA2_76468_c1_seq1:62-433(-)
MISDHDEQLEAFANSLYIDTQDLEQVFALLSNEGKNSVDIDAFVVGCIRLKGAAKSSDVNALLHEQRKEQEIAKSFRDNQVLQLARIERTLKRQMLASQDPSKQSGEQSDPASPQLRQVAWAT